MGIERGTGGDKRRERIGNEDTKGKIEEGNVGGREG